MMTNWKQIAIEFHKSLAQQYSSEEIQQLFLYAFEHITKYSPTQYSLHHKTILKRSEYTKVTHILSELKTNKPIQYILGEAYFYGNQFLVTPHTLIPRTETEELVHLIIKENRNKHDLQIIDIGTGTGCIPISLALNLPANYQAVEISKEALQVAKANNQKFKTNVNFILADILEWDLVFTPEIKYDIIVSNPPYITPKEKESMHPNVLNFEPHTALFIEENHPLLFFDHIANFALVHLCQTGTLYFEVNQYLSNETAELLKKKNFEQVDIIQDIHGADRFIKAKLKS